LLELDGVAVPLINVDSKYGGIGKIGMADLKQETVGRKTRNLSASLSPTRQRGKGSTTPKMGGQIITSKPKKVHSIFDKVRLEDNKANPEIVKILASVNNLAVSLVRNNPQIQKKLFPFYGIFVDRIGVVPFAENVVCEIFRDNAELCKNAPDGLIEQCVQKIAELNRLHGAKEAEAEISLLPAYMEILTVFLSARGIPLTENRRTIMKEMSHPSTSENTMKLYTEPGSPAYNARVRMMKKASAEGSDWRNIPELVYHVHLLDMLSDCCNAENANLIVA
jgi:hypothetical protein